MIMLYLATILLGLEILLFLLIDRKIYNSIYTPVGFLGIPFVLVVSLSAFMGSKIGFLQPEMTTILIFIVGIALFWLPGLVIGMCALDSTIKSYPFASINFKPAFTVILKYISYIFLVIITLGFIRTYLVVGGIGSERFSAAFAGGGLVGHCLSMMKFNAAYLLASEKKNTFGSYVIALATLTFLMIYNVKGWVIITILVSLIARHLVTRAKINIVKVISIVLIGTGIFCISYIIALGSFIPEFLLGHFFHYLFAGVVGLSEHLRNNIATDYDLFMLFQPLRNVVYFILDKEVVGSYSEFWVNIHLLVTKESNVKTFFGDIIVFAGFIKGSAIVMGMGMASYVLLLTTLMKRSGLLLILYLFFMVSFALGWFAYYFNSLFYYEVIIYVFLIWLGVGTLDYWGDRKALSE